MVKHIVVDIKVEPSPMSTSDNERMNHILPNLVQALNFVDLTPRSYAAFLGMFHLTPEVDHIVDMKTMDKYFIEYTEVQDYQYNIPVYPSIDGTKMYYITAPFPIKTIEAMLSVDSARVLQDITAPLRTGSRNPHTVLNFIQRLSTLLIAFDIDTDRAISYVSNLLDTEYGDLVIDEVVHLNDTYRKIKALM